MENINTKNFNLLSPNNERDQINLDLTRMRLALQKLNNPCLNIPAIQIIGTNGKGSICAFLESILQYTEINIGVTTSPHLFDICERIRVNKINIKRNQFEELLRDMQNNLSELSLTPFELIICCGLVYFDTNNVNLLILEAGLGGRLDATTAHKLRPIIAIGHIGIDHTEYLGNSLEEITREKVAVIEKGSHVISCNQNDIAKNIINDRVHKVGAKISWVEPLSNDWELGLKGNFQKQNGAVAVKVANLLVKNGLVIKEDDIRKALTNTKWKGRLEIINWKNKKILIDSAHNSSAAEVLANERKNWINQDKGVFWIIGVQKHKDINMIIKKLIQKIDTVLLVPVPNQKSWSLNEITEIMDYRLNNFIEFKNFKDALQYLRSLDEWPKCFPVLTGSIFLVSEFIKYSQINE